MHVQTFPPSEPRPLLLPAATLHLPTTWPRSLDLGLAATLVDAAAFGTADEAMAAARGHAVQRVRCSPGGIRSLLAATAPTLAVLAAPVPACAQPQAMALAHVVQPFGRHPSPGWMDGFAAAAATERGLVTNPAGGSVSIARKAKP